MITFNLLNPKIYQVTKVDDTVPQGIIKISLKQDEFNRKRDSIEMRICDYFSEEGNLKVEVVPSTDPKDIAEYTSKIVWLSINDAGELEPIVDPESRYLSRGKASYFDVEFSHEGVDPEWKIALINDDDYSEDDIKYYTGLISVTEFEDNTVAIKPAKAGSLVGKKFRLSVSDINGNYYSSIDLEVI